jgi:hypothetical protein
MHLLLSSGLSRLEKKTYLSISATGYAGFKLHEKS